MEFSELVRARRSIRRYQEKPVPKELLRELLETACWAPSGDNRQPWYFLALTDPQEIRRLKAACGTAGTKAKAADLINRRAMSRSDLEKKLREKGAGEGDIRYAAEWLEAIGALNDQDFAAMLARSCAQRFYGPARFREELRRHGVDRALWEEAEELLPPEEEIIENYLRAKVRIPPRDDRERRRLSDSLARRGFSWPAVRTVLRRFGADWADDP